MNHEPVVGIVSRMLIPYILLFAFYTQFHGDYGPGGGFQAGVIAAAAVILYALTHKNTDSRGVFKPAVLEIVMAVGVLLYGGVGIVSMLKGGEFLNYNVLEHDPVHGQHLGILLVELGVGLAVFSVMVTIVQQFAARDQGGNE